VDLAEHQEKARRNWEFLHQISHLTGEHSDWCIVVLSYVTLHLTDVFLLTIGEPQPRSHVKRNETLTRLSLAGVLSQTGLTDYRQLYSRSRSLRYDLIRTTADEFRRLTVGAFRSLEAELQRGIGPQTAPLPKLPIE
jgi:hypothetical protein